MKVVILLLLLVRLNKAVMSYGNNKTRLGEVYEAS